MLTCKELTELVTDYLEGQMPLAQSVSVTLHLSSCRHCRAYVGQMKSLVTLLRNLPADPGPQRVDDQLLLRFQRRPRMGEISPRSRIGTLQLLPS